MQRRQFIQSSAALGTAAAWLPAAQAQPEFPSKPIRLIVPTAPGSVSDAVARAYGDFMTKALKQPATVETMAGAATLLATRYVLKAPADGHTLLMGSNTIVTISHVDRKAGFNPSDFVGVADLSRMPMAMIVGADSPYKSLGQLVEAARKEPGSITFGSVGIGTTSHIPVELFAQEAKIKLTMVPYKGSPLAIPDVVSGRVTIMMGTVPSVGELVRSGKMRALAVTSEARARDFPTVPTFKELGYPEATYELFMCMMAPAGIPAPVLKALSDVVAQAKKDPEVLKRLEGLGQTLSSVNTPEQFNRFLRAEEEKMKRTVKAANIVADS